MPGTQSKLAIALIIIDDDQKMMAQMMFPGPSLLCETVSNDSH